jgi:hypothetical protein
MCFACLPRYLPACRPAYRTRLPACLRASDMYNPSCTRSISDSSPPVPFIPPVSPPSPIPRPPPPTTSRTPPTPTPLPPANKTANPPSHLRSPYAAHLHPPLATRVGPLPTATGTTTMATGGGGGGAVLPGALAPDAPGAFEGMSVERMNEVAAAVRQGGRDRLEAESRGHASIFSQ